MNNMADGQTDDDGCCMEWDNSDVSAPMLANFPIANVPK